MKKTYIIPAIEVIEFAAEQLMVTVSQGSGETDGEGALTNKRQPLGGTWNSDNWNQVEE